MRRPIRLIGLDAWITRQPDEYAGMEPPFPQDEIAEYEDGWDARLGFLNDEWQEWEPLE